MINEDDAIFYHHPENEVFYKQLLDEDDVSQIQKIFNGGIIAANDFGIIATGIRNKLEINTPDFLKERLPIVLFDYLGSIELSPYIRYYKQKCGSIKPHKDKSLYGDFKYTCLIYISDDFEGGKLSLKVSRTAEEMAANNPHLKHKVYTITPRKGYGIVFNKSILHYADDVINGSKNILLIDIASKF